ncbi:MAG: ParB/RepB/Spo0J family partition protein [Polyangiaceae bacterium]|nr:ParB/RepB/Spo0J family partition protein [Polyangiaceae bacterium]
MSDTTSAPEGAAAVFLPVSQIKPSPTQPRRRRRDGADLVESIREHGVLEAVWVRSSGDNEYEIVFGERRWRASISAGRATIKAELHDELSNEDVLVLQNVENAQRADVTPLEEADSYALLRDRFKLTTARIAAKVGREEAHVARRLALAPGPDGRGGLVEAGRKALDDRKITVDAALRLATVTDPDAQREAVEMLLGDWSDEDDEPLGRNRAGAIVRRHFQLRLGKAPFPIGDAALVPKAGPCITCPKRSSAQTLLWGAEADSEDRCTDRPCWKTKADASWARQKAGAEAAGVEIVEGEAAKKLFPYGWLENDREFVDLDDGCCAAQDLRGEELEKAAEELEAAGDAAGASRLRREGDEELEKLTWRATLGEQLKPAKLVRAPDGTVHHLVPRELAEQALGALGKVPAREERDQREPILDAKAHEAALINAEADRKAEAKAWDEIYERAVAQRADPHLWRFLYALAVRAADMTGAGDVLEELAQRHDPESPEQGLLEHALGLARKNDPKALLVELLARQIGGGTWAVEGGLSRAALFFNVDLQSMRAYSRAVVMQEATAASRSAGDEAAGAADEPWRSVLCPTCLREAGRACAAKDGKSDRSKPHKDRVALAAEDRCEGCGCSASIPCETDTGPCGWVAPGLCSECDAAAEAIVEELKRPRKADELVEHLKGLEHDEERLRKQIQRLESTGRSGRNRKGQLVLQEQLFQEPKPRAARRPPEARP